MKPFLFIITLSAILFFSCKKGDTGPAGEQGPAGPQGPQGVAGNANATQYNFGVQNLAAGFSTLSIKTTKDTMDKSAWYVYLFYQANERWYFVPGAGFGGTTTYRVSMGYSTDQVNIYIDKSGPGESYAQAKVVRIYTNRQTGRTEPVDYTNYEAVRSYYKLP